MSESIYNKGINKGGPGKGTLVGNWYEEQCLRDFTGVGRTIVKEHISKKCGNLEEPIITDKKFDNTHDRIYGQRDEQLMYSENYYYGKSKNPADLLPKKGRRQNLIEQEIQQKVAQEMLEMAQEEERRRNMRFFQTTNSATYQPKPHHENTVGRKVMQNQDGKLVPYEQCRDELLQVEHGIGKRNQKQNDDDLVNRIPKGHYANQMPITIYTEALERKNFYMSASTGPNPFAKTSGFTQPLNQTKAVKEFEGNVDFDKEKGNVQFMRTTGKDLIYGDGNPYMRNKVEFSNFQEIQQLILEKYIYTQNQSICNIGQFFLPLFQKADKQKLGSINPIEFKRILKEQINLVLSEAQVSQITKSFNDGTGFILYERLLEQIGQ